MNKKIGIVFALALSALLASNASYAQKSPATPMVEPLQEVDIAYPYRLFGTANVWTFILLNTSNGKAWQVNFSLGDSPALRLSLNEDSLLPKGESPENGRFMLQSTNNMYNFLLLERLDGRIWQLQWSHDAEKRGIVRSIRW